LIFQAIDWALLGECSSLGPNIISAGPQAVDGVLDHVALGLGALAHHGQHFVALALVEALFLADTDHGAGVGP
jgi:hypothetical protein